MTDAGTLIGLGTLINAIAILAGGIAGLTLSKQLSEVWQSRIKVALVIFTIVIACKMMYSGWDGTFRGIFKQGGIAVLSVMLGNVTGKLLRIQKLLNRLGAYAGRQFTEAQKAGERRTNEGFLTCTILFCVGPMAVLGAIEDGVNGRYQILALKGLMDGMAAMAFATTFGWGVLLSILPVVAYQGTITLVASMLKPHLLMNMQDSISLTGGLLMLTLPVVILGLRKVELADYLPALLIAPLLTHWWA